MRATMAAPILAYEDLGLVQGSGWLFRHLDLNMMPRDRLALIGRNGAGKSTLLRLIADQIEADEGRRTIVPGTRVVLLEQEPSLAGFDRLLDYVLSGDDAPARYEADAIAGQLGIDLSREAATASGGERRRAAIVRALAQDPDVLLLDEPTNHLDSPRSSGWRTGWRYPARSSRSATTDVPDALTAPRLARSRPLRREIGFGGFEPGRGGVEEEGARAESWTPS
jgi:ATP-binding cassette subfamily F protein uup